MKALVGAFNQEKALVGAFSVIVKTGCGTDGALHSTSWDHSGEAADIDSNIFLILDISWMCVISFHYGITIAV